MRVYVVVSILSFISVLKCPCHSQGSARLCEETHFCENSRYIFVSSRVFRRPLWMAYRVPDLVDARNRTMNKHNRQIIATLVKHVV